MSAEIKRKFLLKSRPDFLTSRKKQCIRQAYMTLENQKKIKIRQKDGIFYQSFKTGSGEKRNEIIIPLSEIQFEALWSESRDRHLEKTRYNYTLDGCKFTVDQYENNLKGLLTAQISFPGIKEARAFKIPSFFSEEVTFDPRYKNYYLAKLPGDQKKQIPASGIAHSLVGTLPYFKEGSHKKVILITKRKENHWIFPKGQQENKMSLKDVARMESEEEAGIRGKITGAPIRIPYDRSGSMQNLIVFPMEVSKILNNWQEKRERRRTIVTLKEAYALSDRLSVHCGLQYLELFT